jgi:hypothetical protein
MGKISKIVAISVFAAGMACCAGVEAQDRPTATGPGGYISVGAGVSVYQFNYGERKLGGIMAYTDIQPSWRFGIEGEVRSLRYNTDEDVTETTYMAGPRIVILPAGHLRPYVKLLAGDGHYDLPFHFAQGNFFTYAPGAGLDLKVNDFVSVRVIDFEYQVTTQFQSSPNVAPSQTVNYGISAGISFRVTPLSRIPWVRGYKKRPYGFVAGGY